MYSVTVICFHNWNLILELQYVAYKLFYTQNLCHCSEELIEIWRGLNIQPLPTHCNVIDTIASVYFYSLSKTKHPLLSSILLAVSKLGPELHFTVLHLELKSLLLASGFQPQVNRQRWRFFPSGCDICRVWFVFLLSRSPACFLSWHGSVPQRWNNKKIQFLYGRNELWLQLWWLNSK